MLLSAVFACSPSWGTECSAALNSKKTSVLKSLPKLGSNLDNSLLIGNHTRGSLFYDCAAGTTISEKECLAAYYLKLSPNLGDNFGETWIFGKCAK